MTTRRRSPLLALAALALLVPALAACGDDSDEGAATTTTAKSSEELTITDVWARQTQDRGAVYMTITGGSEDDALVKAMVPTDIAGTTEIHETVAASDSSSGDMSGSSTTMGGDMTTTTMGGDMTTTTMAGGMSSGEGDGATTTTMAGSGMMKMQPVDKIEIPAGGTVKLEPGGYHVMMLDMGKTLNPGDTIEVTLTFEKAGTKKVTAEVRAA